MIKVLVADDHNMFVDGIESILKTEKEIKVIGSCYDGPSVITFLEKDIPDILLLDVNLPGKTGIEVCKQLNKSHPKIKILAISMFNEESFVTEILNNGAKGYILKNTGREELLKAIRIVYSGKTYFSKEVTNTIMKSLMNSRKSANKKIGIFPKISKREKEVLKLIIAEFTTQEIAKKLFISLKTVESHRSSLLSKLDVRNTAGLVRVAIENKILE